MVLLQTTFVGQGEVEAHADAGSVVSEGQALSFGHG